MTRSKVLRKEHDIKIMLKMVELMGYDRDLLKSSSEEEEKLKKIVLNEVMKANEMWAEYYRGVMKNGNKQKEMWAEYYRGVMKNGNKQKEMQKSSL